jgi:casein kinase II subunit beta
MKAKFLNGVFGVCPRVLCDRQLVLPVGMSEELSISRVKVYCPKCEDIYVPRVKFVDIDGAYFGTSFPHIFLQVLLNINQAFPQLIPQNKPNQYIPRIYGFKLSTKKGSKYESLPQNEISI